MKSIIITLGGFGEFLRCRLEGKWLYQFATKPNLERLTGGGLWGRVYLGSSPERSYFSFWGGEKNNFPGESYLRCLAYDLPVNPEATLFLGKFLTHDRGTIVRADPVLSPNESALLLRTLAEKTTLPFSWHSLNGEAVISVSRFIPQVELPLPGDIKGHPYQQFLPRGKEYAPILSLVGSAASLLEKHPVNQVRLDLNEPLANFLWLWGTGHGNPPPRVNITDCPCFFSESRRLQGLALYLGCELHGDLANLEKTSAFWWLDFKLNPSGNFSAWIKAFEAFDREVLGRLCQVLQGQPWRLLLIFDDFLREDETAANPWAAFFAATSTGPPRLKKQCRGGRELLRNFVVALK